MPYPRPSSQNVIIRPTIASFFYSMTDTGHVEPILKRFQQQHVGGRIVKEDKLAGAICVLFHQSSKPLWLKRYEVEYL